MELITNTVLQYISLPQTNYALQINGAWGTGKTYYVKNKLKTAIEDESSSNGQVFKFCYISLNGFSSVEQIGEAVFFEIANTKNQLAVQGLKFLGKYGSGLAGIFANVEQSVANVTEDIINKIKSSSTDVLSNIVLCFDDLERIDDSLSIKQVFGFINSNYIEHHHVKVIFISNEQEIEDQENYKIIREKVIGKTLNFFQSESTILEDIVFNVYAENENFIFFFEKEKRNLLQVINFVFEDINLRTLRFVLDSFVILQSEVYSFCKDEKERHEISKTLFLNTLIVGNEYKKGNLSSVKDLSFLYGLSYFYYFPSNKESEEDYAQKFLKRYHRLNDFIDHNVYYFSAVSNYIINGYINNDEFKKEVNSLLEKRNREKLKRTGEENPIEILREYWMYDEEKVKHAQDEVLNRIKENLYLANEYPNLYNLFLMFRNENLIITEEKNVEGVLETGFTKALERWKPTAKLDFWDLNMNQSDGKFQKIIDRLKQKEKEIDYRERKDKVSIWLKAVIQDSVEADMFNNIEHEKDFFKILLDLNFTDEFLNQSSAFIVEMTRFLHHKYLRIINSYEFHSHEIPYIDQLINQVEDYLRDYSEDKIKKHNLYRFMEQLEKVKIHVGKGDNTN
ncbi:P-loop NTPase fold protein [Cytobacillus horneckiae]|uniref:P-loop NTPase fold protein n=1 Tax=Cytobacillus horneckiae TaxID=549687 RepID=UPI002DBDA68D|nr:P-loop NTPase fold protein [Cytobacillus horneckiae]MEC1157810.1 P-loop NTPase fold protein [Cytobacillus horneckiae]MED2940704.1 P-loop NTPase fold protein [Cytobacillus horneckiae]